jgi:ABC-2 type transport system permease protein
MKAAAVNKYFVAFSTQLKHLRAEGIDFLMNLFYIPILAVILYFVWSVVFQYRQDIQGFSFNEIITYALIALLLRRISMNNWLAGIVEKDITEGNILVFLCRPLNFMKYRLATRFAQNFYFAAITIPMAVIVIFLSGLQLNALAFVLAVLIVFLATLFTFIEFYCIGLLAFWIERIWGIRNAVDWIQEILSGTWFPITMFPVLVQNALIFLPFQHLVYTPTALMLGKISLMQGLEGIAILTAWIAGFYFLSNWLWKKGLRKHDGKG